MSPVVAAFSGYATVLALSSGAAALARPRHPALATLVYAVPALASFPLFWSAPGGAAVIASMYGFLVLLRALDARATLRVTSGVDYVLYCLWLRTHASEDRIAAREASTPARALRLARGVALLAAVLVLATIGSRAELWRHHPVLEDLLVASELALGLMGLVDLITVGGTLGVKHFLVDGLAPGFAWSPSLSVFWATAWNRPAAGVLQRGIFIPSGGRRARVRGVLLVFFACGVMHAAPILLGGNDRIVWAWLAAGTLAFFMIQALGVLVDAASRRRGGRPLLFAVFALSLPLYPAPLAIAFGVDGRPPESSTLVVATRALLSR